MGRLLIFVGLSIALTGVFMLWGEKLGLGHLPGDLSIKGERYVLHLPLMTCFVISAVISLVMWLLRR